MSYKYLRWNTTNNRFELNSDVYITGDLILTGTISEGGTTVKKTKDWTGAITGSTVWDPTTGKKFVLTNILINATAACTITLFDGTDSTANRIFKAEMGAKQSIVIPFRKPLESAAVNNILKLTTSATGGQLTVIGYEI